MNPAAANLSMWSLMASSDLMTKFDMVLLLFASIWSWAIIIEKIFTLKRVRKGIKAFEDRFWKSTSLDDLYDGTKKSGTDPMSAVFVAAMREWRRSMSSDGDGFGAITRQRVDRAMDLAMDRELSVLAHRMMFLASTGAVAPFLGLFGTVWGVMHVFHGMGATGTASLTVIAPGIAEALYTTAMGLIAAIPAVLAYNLLSSDIEEISKQVESFAGEFLGIVMRKIDAAPVRTMRRHREESEDEA